jgi:hypothetical protein
MMTRSDATKYRVVNGFNQPWVSDLNYIAITTEHRQSESPCRWQRHKEPCSVFACLMHLMMPIRSGLWEGLLRVASTNALNLPVKLPPDNRLY